MAKLEDDFKQFDEDLDKLVEKYGNKLEDLARVKELFAIVKTKTSEEQVVRPPKSQEATTE